LSLSSFPQDREDKKGRVAMNRRAILKSFDSGTYTATVQLVGSARAYLAGVRVSRAIAAAEMTAGRFVSVEFPDEFNPAEAVVVAVSAP
jgi:hypothetical protein